MSKKFSLFTNNECEILKRSMSEDEIQKLESTSEKIIDSHSDKDLDEMSEYYLVSLGIINSHSKIEEAEREAWNRAIDQSIIIANTFTHAGYKQDTQLIKKLKKLRK